jgi:hypothetical protein
VNGVQSVVRCQCNFDPHSGCVVVRFQFCNLEMKTYNIPRIQMGDHWCRSVSGRIMAGSFPPSSNVTGVKCSIAALATCTMSVSHFQQTNCSYSTSRPTVSDPMNVICLITGDFVNALASSGQQHTNCAGTKKKLELLIGNTVSGRSPAQVQDRARKLRGISVSPRQTTSMTI